MDYKQIGTSSNQLLQREMNAPIAKVPISTDDLNLVEIADNLKSPALKNIPVYVPMGHIGAKKFARQWRTLPCSPAAPTTVFNTNGSLIRFPIQRSAFYRMHNMALRFRLTVASAAVTYCP